MMLKMETCCFVGCPPDYMLWGDDETDIDCVKLKYKLYAYIEQLIASGYVFFLSSMEPGFSIYCSEIVLDLKKIYPHIELVCVLPYKTLPDMLHDKEMVRFYNITACAFRVFSLSDFFTQNCMRECYRYIIDCSSVLVCLLGDYEEAFFAVEFAKKNNIDVMYF